MSTWRGVPTLIRSYIWSCYDPTELEPCLHGGHCPVPGVIDSALREAVGRVAVDPPPARRPAGRAALEFYTRPDHVLAQKQLGLPAVDEPGRGDTQPGAENDV